MLHKYVILLSILAVAVLFYFNFMSNSDIITSKEAPLSIDTLTVKKWESIVHDSVNVKAYPSHKQKSHKDKRNKSQSDTLDTILRIISTLTPLIAPLISHKARNIRQKRKS